MITQKLPVLWCVNNICQYLLILILIESRGQNREICSFRLKCVPFLQASGFDVARHSRRRHSPRVHQDSSLLTLSCIKSFIVARCRTRVCAPIAYRFRIINHRSFRINRSNRDQISRFSRVRASTVRTSQNVIARTAARMRVRITLLLLRRHYYYYYYYTLFFLFYHTIAYHYVSTLPISR